MNSDIDTKLFCLEVRRGQQRDADAKRYRELIGRLASLTADEETELQGLADRMGISTETMRQHAGAWLKAEQLEMRIRRIAELQSKLPSLWAQLAEFDAEFQRTKQDYERQVAPLRNKIDVIERNQMSSAPKQLEDLKWRNRELWLDDPEIAAQVAESERRQRAIKANGWLSR